jgi:hypothetical protein
MAFLFLEPFYGGSHRVFADGWIERSRHRIDLLTLPPRFWKWRMRGAALHFARRVRDPRVYDGLIVSDLMSLSDLKALWGGACPPAPAGCAPGRAVPDRRAAGGAGGVDGALLVEPAGRGVRRRAGPAQ